MCSSDLLSVSEWPTYDEDKTVEATAEIGVQVNGKLRGTISYPNGSSKEQVLAIAREDAKIAPFLEGKNVVKEIYVPNKIVSFVVK